MERSLISLAILKVNWDEKQLDYIDNFVPFVATLVYKKNYKEIKAEEICADFPSEYGLHIPLEPMISILTRCKNRGYIYKKGHLHLPVWDKIQKTEFSTIAVRMEELHDLFLSELQASIKKELAQEVDKDEIQSILIQFLKEHDGEILFAGYKQSMLPDVKADQKEKYIVIKYLQSCLQSDPEKCNHLVNLAIGHALANTIMYGNDLTRYKGKLNNLTVYLDIKFLLRLGGVEGPQRRDNVIDFLEGIVEKGAKIKVFQHTYDETIGILNGAKIWINNRKYYPLKATPVTKYFVENNHSESDIDLSIAKIRSILFKYNIPIEDTPDPQKFREYLVNEEKLESKIVDVYKKNNPFFNEDEKEFTIQKDIKSISAIYLLRKRAKPHYIRDARYLFITANTGLAYAANIFEKEEKNSSYTIPVCVTNVFLGTTIWLDSPAKLETFNTRKLIADCYAAIRPNERLIKKYIQQIEKLSKSGSFSDDEYYFLRTNKSSYQVLEALTFNDEDNFTEKTPDEIIRILKNEGRVESLKDLEDEKQKNSRTREELDKTVKELDITKRKIEKVSRVVSNIVSSVILFILLAFLLLFSVQQFNPDPKIISKIFLIIFAILSTGFGFSFKNISKYFKRLIYTKIHSYFTID
jgi:hypothetical protein